MRELHLHNRENNMPLVVKEVKKTKLITSIHPHKGHTLYEFNVKTGCIQPAQYAEQHANFTGGKNKKVIIKENCLYTSALNIENAQKKFFKHLRSNL